MLYTKGNEWGKGDAAGMGLVVGAIGGIATLAFYRADRGVNEYNHLSSKISSTQPHLRQAMTVVHEIGTAATTSSTAQAALPHAQQKLHTEEAHTHALVLQRDHYHAENVAVEIGAFVGPVAAGVALGLAIRSAFYSIAQPR